MIRTACLSHVLSHTIHSNNRSYTHRSGSFTHSYLRIGHKQFFSHMQFLHIYVNSKVKQQVNERMNERSTEKIHIHTVFTLFAFSHWVRMVVVRSLSYSHFINIVLNFALASAHDFHSLLAK